MKKLLIALVIIALYLIAGGITGFVYIINVGGAGPEKSWGLAMGPFVIGVLLLVGIIATKSTKKFPNHLT
jgi:hypothetical protein